MGLTNKYMYLKRFLIHDASKAFSRVNHGILVNKLLQKGVPCYIVRLHMYWYSNQTICVKWGSIYI